MSRALWDHESAQRAQTQVPRPRNYSIQALGMLFPDAIFHNERRLLTRLDFLLRTYVGCESSYHLTQPPLYYQVLTGVLPRRATDWPTFDSIAPERPSRPTRSSQNRWLPDPVWEVITTGWREVPSERCELSVLHHVFLTSGREVQEVQDIKLGEPNT